MNLAEAGELRQPGLAGRVAVVTGAGSCISAAIAAPLAEGGARVVLFDIDGPAAARTAATSPVSQPVTAEVTGADGVNSSMNHLLEELDPIDVLVNNAGAVLDTPVEELSVGDCARRVEVALTGAFMMIQAALPTMRRRRTASIVNVSSVNATGYFGNDAYSAAKAGLLSLTRSVAVSYGNRGIRCNAVVSGTIRTPIWDGPLAADPGVLDRLSRSYPLGRVCMPDSLAAAVGFLACEYAA